MKERTAPPVLCEGRIDPHQIPSHVGTSIAQVILPSIQRAWADPEFRAEYQRWKAKRAEAPT